MSIVYNVFLFLDGMIYGLIDSIFDVFNFLAKVNLFSNENYMKIVRNVYMILGLIMLFALSYSLLKAVINPDEFAKGEQSFPKMIKNVIISLAIIAVLPTVFNFAFNLQNTILNQHTIPRLILGEEFDGNNNSSPGRLLSYNMFSAFLHVNEEYCTKDNENETVFDTSDAKTCAEDIKTNKSNAKWYKPWRLLNKSETFYDIDTSIKDGEIAMVNYNNFGEAVAEGKLSYLMLISTICGLYILWVLTNFCFDMAVRVIKLVFFQIIAPIPVVCRVIPGGKLKDVFSTWTKKTIGTFVDVFIRVGILYLGIFIIQLVIENWPNLDVSKLSYTQGLIAKALVLMGTVIFIRQAPKLISDMFHLDTGDMKLGLMDKLAAGGALAAGAFLGGGATTLTRNAVNKFGNKKNWLNDQGRVTAGSVLKNLGAGVVSGAAGGLSGAFRSGKAGLKAKNFADMKKSATDGTNAAIEKRFKREKYRSAHSVGGGFIDDMGRVISGHARDSYGSFLNWAGVKNVEQLKLENIGMDQITNTRDQFDNDTDAYITKELSKIDFTDPNNPNGAVLGLGVDDIKDLHRAQDALSLARSNGQGVAQAEKEWNDVLKQARFKMQNQVAVSQSHWDSLSDDEKAKWGTMRKSAVGYKGALYNNSNLEAAREVGLVGADYSQDKDLNVATVSRVNGRDVYAEDATLDAFGKAVKRQKSANEIEIATRSQTEPENKK